MCFFLTRRSVLFLFKKLLQTNLGYPSYFLIILGASKIAGVAAISFLSFR